MNDKPVKSADVQLHHRYQPTILTNEPVVFILEASAMPVRINCLRYLDGVTVVEVEEFSLASGPGGNVC